MFTKIYSDPHYRLMVLLAMEELTPSDIHEARELLKGMDIERLYHICCEHEFESMVYPRLVELYDGELNASWYDAYQRVKQQNKFMMGKLREIADKLDEAGIPIIALKNSGICAALLDDPAKSPMGDIDALVSKDNFVDAHHILTAMGFEFKFRSEYELEDLQQAYIDGGAEYHYSDADGCEMWFELSWRPIAGRWIRVDREPLADELIKSSQLIAGTKARILSPEDNLLQVAIHTAKHSYVRQPGFRLHHDVDRVVRYQDIDWEIFGKKVDAVGAWTAVYFSLYIAQQLYHTPIPQDVMQRLRPKPCKERAISRALRKAGLLHPDEHKFSRMDFVLFQIMLYDRLSDAFRVVIPSVKWLKEKYSFTSPVMIPYYIVLRMLDLVGIRRKKPPTDEIEKGLIVFVTVFMSPHILSECKRLYALTGGKFVVIETGETTAERARLGYRPTDALPFVRRYGNDRKECDRLISNADAMIYALIPNQLINKRIKQNKLTFYSSERLFGKGFIKVFHYKLWKQIWSNLLARNKNTHLLCYGSFVGRDFATIGFSKDKMWRYGYFPKLCRHDIDSLMEAKRSPTIKVLWVGRIVPCKRLMELLKAVEVLRRSEHVPGFVVDIVGDGRAKLVNKAERFIKRHDLEDMVTLHGLKSHDVVMEMMERADVLAMTSSKIEGWGAVINEAMNSGCAVVTSDRVGCADYLIENGVNGLTYRSGKPRDLAKKLNYLINHRDEIKTLGTNAYDTIRSLWNDEVAATRLVQLIHDLQRGKEPSYTSGPCSKETLT